MKAFGVCVDGRDQSPAIQLEVCLLPTGSIYVDGISQIPT